MKTKPFLVWVLCGLQLFYAAGPALAAGPASPPTPAQVMVLQDAAQKGVLTPEAREILRANPELRQYLPPKMREELENGTAPQEGGVAEPGAPAKPAAAKAEGAGETGRPRHVRLAEIGLRLPALPVPPDGQRGSAAYLLRARAVRPEGRGPATGRRPSGPRTITWSGPATSSSSSCGGGWRGRTVCASTGTARSSSRKWAPSPWRGRRSGK